MFCRVAHSTLRNTNASVEVERSFNGCLDSISGKRVNLRTVFKFEFNGFRGVPHMGANFLFIRSKYKCKLFYLRVRI